MLHLNKYNYIFRIIHPHMFLTNCFIGDKQLKIVQLFSQEAAINRVMLEEWSKNVTYIFSRNFSDVPLFLFRFYRYIFIISGDDTIFYPKFHPSFYMRGGEGRGETGVKNG